MLTSWLLIMVYSNEEAFNMLMVLGECFQNFSAAERLYAERFPDLQRQCRKDFVRLAQRVRTTGKVQPSKKRLKAMPVRQTRAPDILAAVELNPHVSTRVLSRESGISQMSVCRILKANDFHPYHISLHQELEADDYLHRINFAIWAQNEISNDPNFAHNVMWSDEATFKNNGNVNRHNMRYWSRENPHWLREVNNQRQWTLNVWCAVFNGQIIGPHFFETNLNGVMYNAFLNEEFLELLRPIPINVQREMWFMQDGCPAHYAIDVRQTLTAMFGDKWIARGGPIPWPARSPDLTVMDFYLWGRLKDMVYGTAPTTRDEMKERIRLACRQINEEEVRLAVNNLPKRLEMVLEVGGRHFEHL